jgi:DNA-binding CsgD family transcriptional regulator
MPDEAARTRRLASQAGHLVPAVGPIPGAHAELFALDRALAQLSAAAIGMIAACRSCRSASTTGYGDRLSLAEVTAAAAQLAAGARTVHAVTGRPDVLGLLTPGPLLRVLGESSAQMKVLCQDVLRTDMGGRRALRELVRSGAQVATTPVPPPPVLIVDRQAAFVTMAEPDRDRPGGAMLVRDPWVAGYLAAAVDSFWANATPLHDAVVRDDDGLSPIDRALLRLLADGMTQQEAARRLQLSVRTVSRRTAELKRQLKAGSPLQAGIEAARRGWL